MFWVVYILYSKKLDCYYIGHTNDLNNRVYRHNHAGSKSTKKAADWLIVFTEQFSTKALACQREIAIKKKKSRRYIEWLIKQP